MNAFLNRLVLAALVGLGAVLEASRPEVFDLPFKTVPPAYLSRSPRRDFPELRRTKQYAFNGLPKCPIFHPKALYPDHLRDVDRALQVLYNLKLPTDFYEALPASLTAQVARLGLAADQVDIFWVVQDQPWAEVPLLFRPHTWCDPDVPTSGFFSHPFTIGAGLHDAPAGIHFQGLAADAWIQAGIEVHGGATGTGPVVSSPDNLPMAGLDPEHTATFWTLTQLGSRAAATLHVLLSDEDREVLDALTPTLNTLRQLVQALDASTLRGTPMVAKLKRLTRPIITGRSLAQAQAWTLTGSGFTGTTAVTQGDDSPLAFTVVSDTILRVTLPEAGLDEGDLRVTTPMGESLPPPTAAAQAQSDPPSGLWAAAPSAPPLVEVPRAALPSLWQRETERTLTVASSDTSDGVYQWLGCTPGDLFEGTCLVRTEAMTSGIAQIMIRFALNGEGPFTYGTDLGAERPCSTRSLERIALGVRGVAPAGANQALIYLQAYQCNAGAKAHFEQVRFRTRRLQPAAEPVLVSAPPNLWQRDPDKTLTAAQDGQDGLYQALSCVPGEVFEGTCMVQTAGMELGFAQINLVFSRTGEPTPAGYGIGKGADLPNVSRSTDPMVLGVRGVAPEGATQVLLLIQVDRCTPGACATFERVAFVRGAAEGPLPGRSHGSAEGPNDRAGGK